MKWGCSIQNWFKEHLEERQIWFDPRPIDQFNSTWMQFWSPVCEESSGVTYAIWVPWCLQPCVYISQFITKEAVPHAPKTNKTLTRNRAKLANVTPVPNSSEDPFSLQQQVEGVLLLSNTTYQLSHPSSFLRLKKRRNIPKSFTTPSF